MFIPMLRVEVGHAVYQVTHVFSLLLLGTIATIFFCCCWCCRRCRRQKRRHPIEPVFSGRSGSRDAVMRTHPVRSEGFRTSPCHARRRVAPRLEETQPIVEAHHLSEQETSVRKRKIKKSSRVQPEVYHSVQVTPTQKSSSGNASYRCSLSSSADFSHGEDFSQRPGTVSPAPGDTLPWNPPEHEWKIQRSSVPARAKRAVLLITDERDKVQKKTFTKWINQHLMKVRKHVNDLYEDLRDGHNLISLIEVLSGDTLPRERDFLKTLRLVSSTEACASEQHEDVEDEDKGPREEGRMRFHRLQNVQIALDYLKKCQAKLVNIRNDDITDGNPKLILGLIWAIILHFQISDIHVTGESEDMTAKERLLLWSQQTTEDYAGICCENFTTCWRDGRLFNAIIHKYRPDLIDMNTVAVQSNLANLENAFFVAEKLGVARLLDPEDVVSSPDEKSVITYVSSLYDAFPKVPEGGEGIGANDVEVKWVEYQNMVNYLMQWIRHHGTIMCDRTFPNNPVELKALYNQYLQFKETEIPPKEMDKSKIKRLYKLLEVWIEFGRIKLPQGYHPNDIEKEWGKLIIAMLEREKTLRPEVERVAKLHDELVAIRTECSSVYNKGHALTTEQTKLMMISGITESLNSGFTTNRSPELNAAVTQGLTPTLTSSSLTSGLSSGLASRLTPAITPAYTPGIPPGLIQSYATGVDSGTLQTLKLMQIRRPLMKSAFVDQNLTEEEVNMKFVQDLLSWVEEVQVQLDRAEWGSDLPSVESHLANRKNVHKAIEKFESSLKEAKISEIQMTAPLKLSYAEKLYKLESQYSKLLNTSRNQERHLDTLHSFVSHATRELIWLKEKEEEEAAYDWSERNTNITRKKEYHAELMRELDQKEVVIKSVQEVAEQLLLENHPARLTIETYRAAMQAHWSWILQLCRCVEQHLRETAAYFEFFSDAEEAMEYLKNLKNTIYRKYSCDRSSSLHRLGDLVQESVKETEDLLQYKSTVAGLVGRAKAIIQLKPRNPDRILKTSIPIKAICDYRQIEVTIWEDDECVLVNNSHCAKWKVISPSGNEAMVPSVCFTVPPPNKEAIDIANRIEQQFQNVLALWHESHVNMKSVVSWHYLRNEIEAVRAGNVASIKTMLPGERQQVLSHLQSRFDDFVEDSQESKIFTSSDTAQLEKEVNVCKQYYQELLKSAEREEQEECIYNLYISKVRNIRLQLESCEERLIRQIRTPVERDGIDESVRRIAEQEELKKELDRLKDDLGVITDNCEEFFSRAAGSPSVPVLRSELSVVVQNMNQVYSMSSIYIDKLKTENLVLKNTQGAELLVKLYENKLCEDEAVTADKNNIENLMGTLKQWRSEVAEKRQVFHALEDELQKAKMISDQMFEVHKERDLDFDWRKEKVDQLAERWQNVHSQIENRLCNLQRINTSLKYYEDTYSSLDTWIQQMEDTQRKIQEIHPENSKALAKQLNQYKMLVPEVEMKQSKLEECQKYSEQYSAAVKDYELQTMTYRESTTAQQKSPVKCQRMQSSSDFIIQEFVDLRTRYTALVTLMSQYMKFASDSLKRLEEEEFHDKIDRTLESLKRIVERLRQPLSISAEVEKIKEQISANKNVSVDLEELQPVYETLKQRGEEMIARSEGTDKDTSAKAVQDKLDQMVLIWEDIQTLTEEREAKMLDVMELAEKFWRDRKTLVATIEDIQDFIREMEGPGVDPSVAKRQLKIAESAKEELDGLQEELETVVSLGSELRAACGEPDKPIVSKSIDELNSAWDALKKTWNEWLGKLVEAMHAAVQYQDGLQQFKTEAYQQQIEMERLNRQAELLLKKVTESDRHTVQDPLSELKLMWDSLEKIISRQHKLEGALLALGQFQHALDELLTWLTHIEDLLNEQKPVGGDPKAIEIELAKHHVLQNDVLAHQSTVEAVKKAGNDLTESSAVEEASNLRSKLELLNQRWQKVLEKTEQRKQQLDSALIQAQGFHGEVEDMQQWLTDTEHQLLESKPVGGLPETAIEQLNTRMLREFANFDIWREKYMRWMNHKKSRVMDFFKRIDKDQDGKITRQEFIDGILSSKFPTSQFEVTAVADIFDRDGDGYIDYYEFVAALHPNEDAYKLLTDADKIEDEVTRQVAKCKCAKRFQVEQIGDNKYRFGDSQQLRLVRILRSPVIVCVGGGCMALNEFLVKNDPCRAEGGTNVEPREKFILADGASQSMAARPPTGCRSQPSSRGGSSNRSTSLSSQARQAAALQALNMCTPEGTPIQGSKLRLPGFLSGRPYRYGKYISTPSTAATGVTAQFAETTRTPGRPGSQAGSKAGSRSSSRRGSDASDLGISEIQSVCSDMSETVPATSRPTPRAGSRPGSAKPSKIPAPQRRPLASKLDKSSKK